MRTFCMRSLCRARSRRMLLKGTGRVSPLCRRWIARGISAAKSPANTAGFKNCNRKIQRLRRARMAFFFGLYGRENLFWRRGDN